MSLKNDNSHGAHSSQAQNHDKAALVNNPQTALLINRILMWVVSIIESPSMRTLESRISLLVCGGWLPGKGDARMLGALTNRPEASIERLVGDKLRPKYHVGRQPFYDMASFAMYDPQHDEDPPNDAPAMRKKRKR